MAVLLVASTIGVAGRPADADSFDDVSWYQTTNPSSPDFGQPFTLYISPGYGPFLFSTLTITQGEPPVVEVTSHDSDVSWTLTPLAEGNFSVYATGYLEKTDCAPGENPPCSQMYFVVSPTYNIHIGSGLPDADGDGCPDIDEQQTAPGSEMLGGLRDDSNPNDYFNPTGDGANRIDDVLMVIGQYYEDEFLDPPTNSVLNPYYTPSTDRTALGPNQWNLGPPNGEQRIDDILAIIYQYFHDCS
jgi:hypothetical protein